MESKKKLAFCTLFVCFLVAVPTAFASADTGRYFVKSTKSFWKNALGVRHLFENGFTTDLSDFQLRLNRLVGLQIEPVKIYQISESEGSTAAILKTSPEPSASVSPSPSASPDKTDKLDKGTRPVRLVPSDPTPWGIETVYNDPNIISTSGGAGVKVAVLDTGADINHPDLKSRIEQCKDFTNFRFPVLDNKCDDKNGHGTHVAGIVAADGGSDSLGIYGVAPEAKLFVYKVCGNSGSCYADDIAAAIIMAADQGANILNMSFGGDNDSSLIHNAINHAVSKGVLPVAAAGNDGPFNSSLDYPAALDSVIAVGALNQTLPLEISQWSSRGINSTTTLDSIQNGDIEFAAPGENIESTYNNGGYVILSGTSMASPFISGMAAKYWQTAKTPVLSAQTTRAYLKGITTDILPAGEDDMSGYGLPQVSK